MLVLEDDEAGAVAEVVERRQFADQVRVRLRPVAGRAGRFAGREVGEAPVPRVLVPDDRLETEDLLCDGSDPVVDVAIP